MIIDAHAHVGHGRYKSLSASELLREMDVDAVDRAVICPVEEQIILHNRAGNDETLALVRRHRDRFVGFAVANPWYGVAAVEELRRALGEGLCGLKLHPVRQGFSACDPLVHPLVEVAAAHRVPVYAHTGSPHYYGEPFQLAELARCYPGVTFIVGHAGASDYWGDLPRCHQFAPNLLFETSRNGPGNFAYMLQTVGADRMVFGSNLPESPYALELAAIRDVVGEACDLERILWQNIAHALGQR